MSSFKFWVLFIGLGTSWVHVFSLSPAATSDSNLFFFQMSFSGDSPNPAAGVKEKDQNLPGLAMGRAEERWTREESQMTLTLPAPAPGGHQAGFPNS